MAAAASELEQLAWGANEFEKDHDGFWAALLSARGQELLAGTGLEHQPAAWFVDTLAQQQQMRSCFSYLSVSGVEAAGLVRESPTLQEQKRADTRPAPAQL